MNSKPALPKFIGIVALLVFLTSLFRINVGITIIRALVDGHTPDLSIVYVWIDIATTLLAGIFGVFGSGSLLKREEKSIYLCWASVGFNSVNILGAFIAFQFLPMELPFFDTVVAGLIRIAFTILFVFAILQAKKWFRSQKEINHES